MYNRYQGNSGRVERVAEPERNRSAASPPPNPRPAPAPPPREIRPPSPLSGLSGELGRIIEKLSGKGLETEDFLLIVILYLLYRDSGDEEFLFAIGGLLLF